MRILKTILVERVEATAIVCNRCGMSFDCGEEFENNLIHNFNIGFGYGSKHDLERWSFDLCETCIEKLVKTFKIKVTKFDCDVFGDRICISLDGRLFRIKLLFNSRVRIPEFLFQ